MTIREILAWVLGGGGGGSVIILLLRIAFQIGRLAEALKQQIERNSADHKRYESHLQWHQQRGR